ncbi:MAG: iron chelate uptake ABC transporter family permease subunit, partial [Betaproteobacteria bacterium]|nr:iron chelate uptake ABC transporter family permease subunit [Betaproteobacteria bacterium]
MRRAVQVWLILCVAGAMVLLGALSLGSMPISAIDAVQFLLRPENSPASEVIHHLRLPRALAAFAAGGLLAVAGALMQVL